MPHTFVFRGTTERNPRLGPEATHFVTVKGAKRQIRRPKIDGLIFGFMEAPEGIVITQVDEVALRKRIVVQRKRHVEGGGLGPNGRNIGDKAAARVLEDVLAANKDLRRNLEAKRGKLRGSR
jgi:hypothetical protein